MPEGGSQELGGVHQGLEGGLQEQVDAPLEPEDELQLMEEGGPLELGGGPLELGGAPQGLVGALQGLEGALQGLEDGPQELGDGPQMLVGVLLGRSRGPRGSRPSGGHRRKRQATRWRWGQGIREWWARR